MTKRCVPDIDVAAEFDGSDFETLTITFSGNVHFYDRERAIAGLAPPTPGQEKRCTNFGDKEHIDWTLMPDFELDAKIEEFKSKLFLHNPAYAETLDSFIKAGKMKVDPREMEAKTGISAD
jgi:hypothetical protein